ncbi:MAG: hypothetical protein K6E10_05560 [Eubacterium sp.]|nr:hypothetical protein [Eubacterium sp.]
MRFSIFLKILSIAFFILGCVFLVLQAIDNKNYDKEVTAVVTYVESHKSDDGRYTYNAHCKYKVGNKEYTYENGWSKVRYKENDEITIRINSDYPEKANKHYYKLAAIVFYFLAVMLFLASFIDSER